MSNNAPGVIVWRELHADSLEKADAFYTALADWTGKTQQMEGMGDYVVWRQGEKMLAGAMNKPNAEAPPHWLDYFYTEDLEATVDTIVEEGGTVIMGPSEIPGMGRFAIAADPTGAVFAPFHSNWKEAPTDERPDDFTFCWTQVNSTDMHASAAFFAKVFNWEVNEMPGDDEVVSLNVGEHSIISVMQMPEDSEAPSHFIDYLAVPDIAEYHEKATGLGAMGYVPPTDIPTMGAFSVLADTNGAIFALWEDRSA